MRRNLERQDTGRTQRTEWRVRPARPSDRSFILGITPRLAQGRSLVEAAEGWARSERLDLITLNVFANNQRARSVYERLGYAPETLRYVKPLT